MKFFPTYLKITTAIVICLVVGGISGLVTTNSIESWYSLINKPSFNPPNWIFGPVWTLLYILMGISAALVWNKGWKKREVKQALTIFILQLVLNSLWTLIFFGLHNPLFAFIEIVILWVAIMLTILKFFKISRLSGYLMLPYILWVSFAGVLNLAIVLLN